MAIKYIHIPEQKKTIAVISNAKYAAVHQISRMVNNSKSILFDPCEYLMSDSYRAVVVCHDEDKYSAEEGECMAKRKLLNKYYGALDKRVDAFIADMNLVNKRINARHKNLK